MTPVRQMMRTEKDDRDMAKKKMKFLKLVLLKIPAGLFVFSLLWVLVLKWVPVYFTPLMISRSIEFRHDKNFRTVKEWRPLESISPEMRMAVIASEDNLFTSHHGFDWEQVRKAIDDHQKRGRRLRGASTISQQTAKNVFLLPAHNMFRKGLEAYFTVLIELVWGKERILEVYLNVAETGRGLYGTQAAARTYFNRDASGLTRRQACLIAACLPNPLKRSPANPSSYVSGRAGEISRNIGNLNYPEWVRNP